MRNIDKSRLKPKEGAHINSWALRAHIYVQERLLFYSSLHPHCLAQGLENRKGSISIFDLPIWPEAPWQPS
jgi:hypothetical protein